MARTYAPSRLHKQPVAPQTTPQPATQDIKQRVSQSAKQHQKSPPWQLPQPIKRRFADYLRYSICLLLALLGYYATYQLMLRTYPSQIQHFLWNNNYLPFTTLVFVSNFFFFTFVTLNQKWGFYLSTVVALILYWRLNQIEFDLPALVIIATTSAILFFLIFQDIMVKNHGKK